MRACFARIFSKPIRPDTKDSAAFQASDEPAWILAEHFGITEQTVWKRRKRDSSHTAYRPQTTLPPAQEATAVALRKTLLVSLGDLLAEVREFLNPDVARSGLDRCLRQLSVGNVRDLKAKTPRLYLFVSIDWATRWVFIRVDNGKTAAKARRVLRDLELNYPMRIRTILAERAKSAISPGTMASGKELTDRLFGLHKRAQTRKHQFDKL